jgi:hypothetical protein
MSGEIQVFERSRFRSVSRFCRGSNLEGLRETRNRNWDIWASGVAEMDISRIQVCNVSAEPSGWMLTHLSFLNVYPYVISSEFLTTLCRGQLAAYGNDEYFE